MAFVGAAVCVLLARFVISFHAIWNAEKLVRGPHETRWIGWRGGTQLLKREKLTDLSPHAITEKVRGEEGADHWR